MQGELCIVSEAKYMIPNDISGFGASADRLKIKPLSRKRPKAGMAKEKNPVKYIIKDLTLYEL